MQTSSFAVALIATVSWGLWGYFSSLASESIPPGLTVIITYLIGTVFGIGYMVSRQTSLSVLSKAGLTHAIAGGMFLGIGGLAYYYALGNGRASTVTAVAGLYFVVTALLGIVFLGEQLAHTEIAGLLLAVVAGILLAI